MFFESTKASVGAIQKLLTKATELGLSWPLPDELDDTRLAQLFYPGADTTTSSRYQLPDWLEIHQELKRKGMTKLSKSGHPLKFRAILGGCP